MTTRDSRDELADARPGFLPTPLRAGKKKADPPPPVNLGEQRVKAYFDIAKIVWPNPPAIPRIAFQELFTGEKIDPSLYTKKGHKQTWMDRLAGTQTDRRDQDRTTSPSN